MLHGATVERPLQRHRVTAATRVIAESLPLLIAVGVSLALGAPMLLFPLGPDQSIFAYIAHRISQGGFPYVTAWDQKPPAIYLLYVIAIHMPGPMMRNVRLFDLCMLCLTLIAIYVLARYLWGRWAGGFAALLYGAAYTTEYGYWHTAQPDGYTALPLAVGAWLYYRYLDRSIWWAYVLAGALTGFAFQLRFFSALIGVALIYIEWNHAPQTTHFRLAGPVRRIALFSLGFLFTQILFALYLLAGHALGAYLFTEFRFATGYARLGGPYSPNGFRWDLYLNAARGSTLDFLYSHMFISLPAGVALVSAFRARGDRRVREVGLMALMAYAGVLVQAKFFLYHWLAVLPFAALLGGKGLAQLQGWLFREHARTRAFASLATTLAVLVILTPVLSDTTLQQWRGVAQYFGGALSRHTYNNQFGAYAGGTYSYLADDEVARYLAQHTEPSDTIYVYGYEPLIYLLSGRESASRFIYIFPVISTWSPPAWKAEFLQDLSDRRPRYILVQANEGAPWIDGLHEDTAEYAAHDAGLQQLLSARYVEDRQIEDFTLYRLRG